jgi:hypothetical protein
LLILVGCCDRFLNLCLIRFCIRWWSGDEHDLIMFFSIESMIEAVFWISSVTEILLCTSVIFYYLWLYEFGSGSVLSSLCQFLAKFFGKEYFWDLAVAIDPWLLLAVLFLSTGYCCDVFLAFTRSSSWSTCLIFTTVTVLACWWYLGFVCHLYGCVWLWSFSFFLT